MNCPTHGPSLHHVCPTCRAEAASVERIAAAASEAARTERVREGYVRPRKIQGLPDIADAADL